jgi:hypothetical protein
MNAQLLASDARVPDDYAGASAPAYRAGWNDAIAALAAPKEAGGRLQTLPSKWRGPFLGRSNRLDEGARLAYRACADELEAALATPSPQDRATGEGAVEGGDVLARDMEAWLEQPFVNLTPMRRMDVEAFIARVRALTASPQVQGGEARCSLCGASGLHACTGQPIRPWTEQEKRDVVTAMQRIVDREATPQRAPGVDDTHAFKNFHRLLCERFDYAHDDIDWRRDQVSLIEHVARKIAAPVSAVGAKPLDASWPLMDRVEFALRDAGFDYDEAFRVAYDAAKAQADRITASGECQHRWQPDADVEGAVYCPKCDVTRSAPRD